MDNGTSLNLRKNLNLLGSATFPHQEEAPMKLCMIKIEERQ